MSTYLIDFENVKSAGLAGIDRIAPADSVHLFWSTRENKISIEMMELIRKSQSLIEMHKASTGERDALDHQLCSYLGYLAGQAKDNSFVIISNDKAYDHLIEFWKEMRPDIRIQRVNEIGKAVIVEKKKVEQPVKPVITEPVIEKQTAEVVETLVTENRSRGQRRRERDRGQRYLHGQKNQRDRKRQNEDGEVKEAAAAYTAEEAQTEKPVDYVIETPAAVTVEEVKEEEVPSVITEAEAENETIAEKAAAAEETPAEEAPLEEAVETVTAREEEAKQPESVKEEMTTQEVTAEETPAAVLDFYAEPVVEEPLTVEKPLVNVVGGITSSVVEQSGFTANGIMDNWIAPAAEITAEEVKEEEVPLEETPEEAAEIPAAQEVSEEETPVLAQVVPVEEAVPAPVTEEVVSDAVMAAEDKETKEGAPVEEAPVEETAVEDTPADKPKRRRNQRNRRNRVKAENAEEAAKEAPKEEAAKEAEEQVAAEPKKKAPAKKKPAAVKEKAPVTREAVMERAEEARDAVWLDDVVAIMNENPRNRVYNVLRSRIGREVDMKEFYAKIKGLL